MKNDTLKQLLLGIISIGILAQIILLIFFDKHWYHAVGLWCGITVAVFSAIQIKRSAEDALDYGADAENYTRRQYVLRMLIAGIVIGAILYLEYGNPITILVGVSALQLSAFLQPITEKIINKIEQTRKGGCKGDRE